MTAIQTTSLSPYAANPDETDLGTTDASNTEAAIVVTISLNGTIGQIQAGWATLAAVALTVPSAVMGWSEA